MKMKKPPLPWSSRELECVGRLEFAGPNRIIGFLCSSIPVPTDKTFHETYNSAFIPSRPTVSAPWYQLLPMETDLTRPPLVQNVPEKVLPVGAVQSKVNKGSAIESNLSRKCEALAVSGLVEYGDEINVIALADILKQIFKIPYSEVRVSIAVHHVGQTLIMNTWREVDTKP